MVVMQAISQSLEKLYKWVLTELSNADSNDVYTVRIEATFIRVFCYSSRSWLNFCVLLLISAVILIPEPE